VHSHTQTWLSIEDLGSRILPYLPTYDFSSPHIDEAHGAIANATLNEDSLIQMPNGGWFASAIQGWLRREDALKLYELAYFASGDILELGSYHGLSTSIIARAALNSCKPKHIESVDLDPACTKATKNNLKRLGLLKLVNVRTADAVVAIEEYAAKQAQFGFVFIDHSHAYQPVYDACKALGRVTSPGGFWLFHDFNDHRNRDTTNKDYGVYQAVVDSLDMNQFEFYGIYGCTGLFRRVLK